MQVARHSGMGNREWQHGQLGAAIRAARHGGADDKAWQCQNTVPNLLIYD